MTDTSSPGRDEPAAVAAYIAAMVSEMARLARASGLSTLAYVLDMAHLEAKAAAIEGADGDSLPAARHRP